MSKRLEFGYLPNGEVVYEYELSNEDITVHILSYGAIIKDFIVKSLNRNIVLGYDTLQDYLQGTAYLGATVGRVANRISGARTEINGVEYTWTPNNGPNLLHSGAESLSFINWAQKDRDDLVKLEKALALGPVWHDNSQTKQEENTLILGATLDSDGFPGVLDVTLFIRLEGTALHLSYAYETSENSVVNITGHSYFNLNGHPADAITDVELKPVTAESKLDTQSMSVANHEVYLKAKQMAPFGAHSIPTGDILDVEGTAYDFTNWSSIGERLQAHKDLLEEWRGYDHYYLFKGKEGIARKESIDSSKSLQLGQNYQSELALCGEFRVPDLSLQIYSDAPGYQFYTGNWLQDIGHGGTVYGPHAGMCIEPQFIPDDCNLPGFQQSFTQAGHTYVRHIVYEVEV